MRVARGETAFLSYYRQWFETQNAFESWLAAMRQPAKPIFRVVRGRREAVYDLWKSNGLTIENLPWYTDGLLWPPEIPFGNLVPGVVEHWLYPMQAASLLPVLALGIRPKDQVLDACAAPGGKALFIAEQLRFTSQLVANDVSHERVWRMKALFTDFGMNDIRTKLAAAEHLGREWLNTFDAVLVDAPCSSEEHVYTSPEHLAQWSYSRVKKLHIKQVGLVRSLLPTLKPGGRLVYATCAVTPEENEAVVAEVLMHEGGRLMLEPLRIPDLSLEPGWNGPWGEWVNLALVGRALPHVQGYGTMFIAAFKKVGDG